jgi:hypothetical protein
VAERKTLVIEFTRALTLVTAADTAESSFDVTLPPPPPAAEIRFERALITLCSPCVETPPAERAEIPDRNELTESTRAERPAAAAESSVDVTLPPPPPVAEIRFERASMTACNPVALPPPADTADTFDTAERMWLTADWTLSTLAESPASPADTAFDTTEIACDSAEARSERAALRADTEAARAEASAEILFDKALITLWKP